MKKAPLAAANGAKSREETPKRGGGRTYRHHRSLGDVATIRGICPAQCEAAHTTQESMFVCA
jgi:hypothetical protein